MQATVTHKYGVFWQSTPDYHGITSSNTIAAKTAEEARAVGKHLSVHPWVNKSNNAGTFSLRTVKVTDTRTETVGELTHDAVYTLDEYATAAGKTQLTRTSGVAKSEVADPVPDIEI